MDNMGTFYLPIFLLSLVQIQHTLADCRITSIQSPSAATLDLKWNSYSGATNYFLDLRSLNATNVAPVVVTLPASITQRMVQGLRPGNFYKVTLKVFQFYYVICTDTQLGLTVPATSQITFAKALSSTSLRFEWSGVTGADRYFFLLEELNATKPTVDKGRYNLTFTTLSGQVDNLTPATAYGFSVYTSNVAGLGASSTIRTITTLVQPPNGVSLVGTGASTARVSWLPVHKVLQYQVLVSNNNNPAVEPVARNTSSTVMEVMGLEPCTTYTVGVSSINAFLQAGEASNVTHTTSTIDAVTSISVQYSCSSGMATVAWGPVFGAKSYVATATDGTGAALTCSSSTSSCQVTMLECGEAYLVRVTAVSAACQNTSSASASFETVPCAPANMATYRECSSNVIIFSWDATNNTNHYVATSLDAAGRVVECHTTDTSCFFTNTGCGNTYQYTVYAISGECNSGVSTPTHVKTSPCIPQNVKTLADCDSDVLVTTWDSAAGALSYTLEAEGNKGDRYNCSSFSNSCAIPGILCGQSLSVWITAWDDDCTTNRVLGDGAETVPCPPTSVSALVNCRPDAATFNWTVSNGAVFYIAEARHADGTVLSCVSVGTNCLVEGLRCGQTYTGSVIATNLKCNSSVSQHFALDTAPCPPDQIEAFRDCAANHALVVWQNSLPTGSYTAVIQDQNGGRLSCNTTLNNCIIPQLVCGQIYNVTVTYDDGLCPSTSAPIRMESVPCGPQNVSTSVACDTGLLTVRWTVAVPGENYTTMITKGAGQLTGCRSNDTQCIMGGLECGTTYMVTVFSVHDNCLSLPSSDVIVQTVPCPPTNVSATRSCGRGSVVVDWEASPSALNYTAVAVGDGGHRSECSTNGTSCVLPELLCGQVYAVGVAGTDDLCTSQPGRTVSLQTVPCPPSNLSSQLNCSGGQAQLSWSPSPQAVTYAGRAVGPNGQLLSCNTSTPGCLLSGLLCGQSYNLSVSASDSTCVSPYSAPFAQDSAPCAPVNVAITRDCATNSLLVSWDAAAMPLNYSATARAGDGTAIACETGTTSCSLTGLQCGLQYTVTVEASYGSCYGPLSSPQTIQSGPCAPANVTGQMVCVTHALLASWGPARSATAYVAAVTGPNGYSETCNTTGLACAFSRPQCASRYTITVTSHSDTCSSPPSQAASMTTAPCDPASVTSALQCGSNGATVSWGASDGAVAYTALAVGGSTQSSASCRSNTTSCDLAQLDCGTQYNLSVLAEGDSCSSAGEVSAVLRTAPCPPTILSSGLVCGTSSAVLSWTSVTYATGYVANATSTQGHAASCGSANASCELTGLLCGQTYSATVTAQGDRCAGAPSTSVDITTAPCTPVMVTALYRCGANEVLVSWANRTANHSFVAQLEAGGQQRSCATTESSCTFSGLQCGQNYSATVQALGQQCSSNLSRAERFVTVPCAPSNVSAGPACGDSPSPVSWSGSPGATAYHVTALGRDGDARFCGANGTGCQMAGMRCGQAYGITVTPYADSCAGVSSLSYTFNAGPCPPTNVTASLQCEGNVGVVAWAPVAGADSYLATATGADGRTLNCSSSSTSCLFTGLLCAQTYSFTVAALNRGCRSNPSQVVVLETALCPPSNLTGQVSCEANLLTLTWDQSPVAGANYILHSQEIGGANTTLLYSVSGTNYTVPGLRCGQRFAFRVAASNRGCNSSTSPPLELSTTPCQPTNLSARVDCGTNLGNFSWEGSAGAAFYVAVVTGENGLAASCSSNDTSCAVKLLCGHSYSVTLVASTDACNSTMHAGIYFDSAPCLPEKVLAELDCGSNQLAVSWPQTPSSVTYTALAIGGDGHQATCRSNSTRCSIAGLRCGQTYEVAVTSTAINCSVIAGSDYRIQSAPCKPRNTTVDLECGSNVATMSWNQTSTAQNYTATASDASGLNSSCTTNGSSCSFLDLRCGTRYTFAAVGHTNVCASEVSAPVERITAPCAPSNVSASLRCGTGLALVTWSPAVGAVAYVVQAQDSQGNNFTCSDTGTQCNLSNLTCGQQYRVVVMAMTAGCPGPASLPVTLTTAPCSPEPLNTQLDCLSGVLTLAWQQSNQTISYHATIQSVSDVMTYDTNSTSVVVPNLRCGLSYNVTVVTQGNSCNTSSAANQLSTAPCPPTSVSAAVNCSTNVATVTWDPQTAQGLSYRAQAVDRQGVSTACSSTASACSLTGLRCGSTYNVTVTVSRGNCSSLPSSAYALQTAPCVPQLAGVELPCAASDTASVAWTTGAAGGLLHEVTADDGSGGRSLRCNSSDVASCLVSGLRCGRAYRFSVTAADGQCTSAPSASLQSATAPCLPQNVQTSVACQSGTASVTWSPSQGALSYTAVLQSSGGTSTSCTSNTTGCDVSFQSCGETYNVTVVAKGQRCDSSQSVGPVVKTAPCAPSGLSSNLTCSSNTAKINWNGTNGAESYNVLANSSGGYLASCQSAGTSCDLSALQCGQTYTVTVSARGNNCTSAPSQSVNFKSVPCVPMAVLTDMTCLSNVLTISWSQSNDSDYHTATVEDSDGLGTNCKSTGTQCNVTGLSCGKTYHVSVTASDSQCTSKPGNSTSTYSVPCTPSGIGAVLNCQNRTTTISWQPSTGAVSYVTTATARSGNRSSCATISPYCVLSALDCGEEYTVAVEAVGGSCNSTARMAGNFSTEPCVPTRLSVQYSLGIGQVMWDAALGASAYRAKAVSAQGLTATCLGNDTNCALVDVQCGQIYSVSVTAQNPACNDTATSGPYTLTTEPCPPSNVTASMACGSLRASVSWEPSATAAGYSATLVGRNGHVVSCVTANASCDVAGMSCGTVYYIRVKAIGNAYNSSESIGVSLTSAPCLPSNVQASADCSANGSALLSWDWSDGADNYTLRAVGAGGEEASCTTSQNNCSVSGLRCGRRYNLSLSAVNQGCQVTVPTNVTLNTPPCVPQALVSSLDCGLNVASLGWNSSLGADVYEVAAVARNGHRVSLRANTTLTQLSGLTCGQVYDLTVVAANQQCTSAPSDPKELQTGPCSPTTVSSSLDCLSGIAVVSWQDGNGTDYYTASLVTDNGLSQTCMSATSQCSVPGLACGRNFSVSVTASNLKCNSTSSVSTRLQAVPCVPVGVLVKRDCANHVAVVSWSASQGALWYSVSAQSSGGNYTWQGSQLNCSLANLTCGSLYTVQVVAVGDNCSSTPSQPVAFHSEPCVPVQVAGSLDCASGNVSVSWKQAEGATNYTAVATAPGGYASTCNTSGTGCVFGDLLCGRIYSFSVSASDSTCSSNNSSPITVETAPCAVRNASAAVDCASNTAVVSWETSGAAYGVTAVGPDGHRATCNGSAASCALPALHCGQPYNVSVAALGGVCNGVRAHLSLRTGPCAPVNLQIASQCSLNSTSVIWEGGRGAVSYVAVGVSASGYTSSCNSSATSCDLGGLQCGQTYNVTVCSMDNSCQSIQSVSSVVQTASCPPQNVSAQLNCSSGTVLVTWDTTANAQYFLLEALPSNGSGPLCNTTDTRCSVGGLPCGVAMQLQLTTVKGGCRSLPSQPLNIQSAPCQPQNVTGALNCVTNSAWVSWNSTPGVESYTVSALGVGGRVSNCTAASSSNGTCEVPGLACGVSYTFQVTASSSQCDSPPSTTFSLETAPCAMSSITALARCHNASILVVWQPVGGNGPRPLYVATAEASDRRQLTCNSTGSSCELRGARCGLRHTVIVAASSDQCSSLRSPPYTIAMEPCPPENVTVVSACGEQGALVSWSLSPVAEAYQVTAAGQSGDVRTCNTSAGNCSLSGLRCGQQYSVSIVASHENCSSKASQNVTFRSAPCKPTGLSAVVQCVNQSAALSWTANAGAVGYYGCAQAEDGSKLTCQSPQASCSLAGLLCGVQYNFTVQASDGTCNSSLSEPLVIGAAPCPPDSMQVRALPVQNETQVIRFTWPKVSCPDVFYLLEVRGNLLGDETALFDVASYWTSTVYFEVPMPCGSSFTATVRSRNSGGVSAPSGAINGTTAPCAPMAVTYRGNSTSATVSWNASLHAIRYNVYDTSTGGRTPVCATALLSCSTVNVGQGYLAVTASNWAGESNPATVTTVLTNRRRRALNQEGLGSYGSETGSSLVPEVRATVETSTVILVEWSTVAGASQYSLMVRQQGSTQKAQVLTVIGESTIVTDLIPDTTYCLLVSAKSSTSHGPYSKPLCVKMGVQM